MFRLYIQQCRTSCRRFRCIKFIISIYLASFIERILPSVPWHHRVFHEDIKPKIRYIKYQIVTISFFVCRCGMALDSDTDIRYPTLDPAAQHQEIVNSCLVDGAATDSDRSTCFCVLVPELPSAARQKYFLSLDGATIQGRLLLLLLAHI